MANRIIVFAILTAVIFIASDCFSTDATGSNSFDFLIGEWRVHHRYLRVQVDHREWVEVDGTCSNRKLMNGSVNIDECTINTQNGTNHALALRSFDLKTGEWTIWWLDGRYPSGPLDPPMKGNFENGIGTFYSDYTDKDKPMGMRFIWSQITSTSARWEQAVSADDGKNWETNWIMEFQRNPKNDSSPNSAKPAQVAINASSDFDFLTGDWRVNHMRLQPGRNEWLEFDGTCSNRKIMNGSANIEEHTLNAPNGAYSAIGLRSYDLKNKQWSIWWLDGRYPSGPIDPPVMGSFENGVGKFYSDYTDNGKPMRERFLWSQITTTSARWEQATSADDGKTWKPNWIMEFRRVS